MGEEGAVGVAWIGQLGWPTETSGRKAKSEVARASHRPRWSPVLEDRVLGSRQYENLT
jgi:hypothetical protein